MDMSFLATHRIRLFVTVTFQGLDSQSQVISIVSPDSWTVLFVVLSEIEEAAGGRLGIHLAISVLSAECVCKFWHRCILAISFTVPVTP